MFDISSADQERRDRNLPTHEARAICQHLEAERDKELYAEAKAVAGLEGDR